MKYNILVFPCGSEIALEIYRSLKFSNHVNLFGANSVDDHGKFIFENYIGGVPFYNSENFIDRINEIIEEYKIDAIYPAMDSVITEFSKYSNHINCKIIGSNDITNKICLSKKKTYEILKNKIQCPKEYSFEKISENDFPLFLKPEIGYGSRGTLKVYNKDQINNHLQSYPDSLILEFLPGKEITIDCFTDRNGNLRFFGARERRRISNGISVNTILYKDNKEEIENIVNNINNTIQFRGAWFVQLKKDVNNNFSLLEIASRLGGSSSLYRNLGINFSLLSVYDIFDNDVKIFYNHFNIELDRALDNKYKISIYYEEVYCDFDDCLIIENKVNIQLLSFLFQCINETKKVILITKHNKNIQETLVKYRLENLFDSIIHLKSDDNKYKFIKNLNSIFIDDSYQERFEVYNKLNIPVFSPDNVEALLK
ncbi:ATP-grasp domain-containing protein [Chishuiella sp.]|uniref:ATP-grasp domain-containing protein n=1 Tax=Chishuiella sp. TaxID=1969467 RepID=UPI0028AB881C|nr:ATP-grasp domain-containing protein [Chishuiella sp.]